MITKKTIIKLIFSLVTLLFFGAWSIYTYIYTAANIDRRYDNISPFTLGKLSKSELLLIIDAANKGNCNLAEKLGEYHFYVSLDLIQAERYHRIGAKCHKPNSLTALIAILRTPDTDDEVDTLVKILMRVDRAQGESAAQEVALRRAERTVNGSQAKNHK